MDENSFKEYLSERYLDQISWYSAKAKINKRRYHVFQWVVIVLAAIMPVLVATTHKQIGLDESSYWWTTLLVSVSLGIGTAAVKIFKFQENWIIYRATAEKLAQEKYFYDGNVGEYGETDQKESLFVKRVETLLAGESSQWVSAQSSNN